MNIQNLAGFLHKKSIKAEMIEGYESLEVLGVSNKKGIVVTDHKKSKDLSKYQLIEEGDFAYNPYRINVGSIGLTPRGVRGLVSPAYVVFKTNESLLPELLLDYLKSKNGLFQINKYARGTVRKALRFDDLCLIEMPILDITKQVSILKKKESVEIEIDRINIELCQQQNLLKKLRQQILQDAIEGKLTKDWREQNPDVEPASELLKRIQAEKQQLIKDKKIKKQKALPEITEGEKPFELPESWEWCRLDDIGETKIGLTYKPSDKSTDGTIVLRSSNIQKGKIDLNDLVRVSVDVNENKITDVGDILICARNGSRHLVGKSAVIMEHGMSFGAFMSIFRSDFYQYIYTFLQSNIFRNQFDDVKSTGIAQLTQGVLRNIVIPFPPLDEHIEIVKKVEKLFAICDQLEEQITSSQTNAEQLMQSVLKEAFSQDEKAA